ncbi:hemin-degrading factor [Aquiflexum gelatinilyticum]|uniref:Hemin-degrading factor n=1 Tax=Aquiflexum gelatinilyticum TaxID=2961943 RepID=A0A9X2P4F3_9BACT|nr:ChuX/HutX family heme-like substrate-binding protein [Aquiflexum gelatinilyticum]MCR9015097.1 hemin-degrading factor [Aquiflexum gelatinilyticum]
MESTLQFSSVASLKEAWEDLKKQNPQIRSRDAAQRLGVSEAELIASTIGTGAVRLNQNFAEIMIACKSLGKVMALTRNEGCVLEHKGNFQKIDLMGHAPNQVATVIGPIEQRIFFSGWKFGFAVINHSPRGTMKSFQFFDKAGDAVLKIFLQEKSNLDAYDQIQVDFKSEDQSMELELEAYPKPEFAKKIDMEAFTYDWENMKDTHDFFGMLRKYNVHRLDAVKWINDKWAYEVDRLSARKIVETASAEKMPIMIFAGNKGNIQIHQGKVRTIRQMGNWLNVMDPDFNMHLNEEIIESAYVVHKNTSDGLVSSLELFDKEGEMIAQFFGLRKPGIPQLDAWKQLIDCL